MAKKGKERKRRDGGEAGFLAEYEAGHFARPSLTVDVALLTATDVSLHALLLHRRQHPLAASAYSRHRWEMPMELKAAGMFVERAELSLQKLA